MSNPIEALPHEKKIIEYQKTIDRLKKNQDGDLFNAEIQKLEEKLHLLKQETYANLTAWERVMISRHPQRPKSVNFIQGVFDTFYELHGDRLFRDDHAVIGGFASIGSLKCMVIGQEKGANTEERMKRNFGMLHPEGFRKALRLMKLAEKFHLPVVTFLDTPGAYPGLEAEERGQGWAIAKNLMEMARLKTPIVVVVIGEGCSGGALGMGVGDVVGMLEHAYYSVISPEGCASILWKDPEKNIDAAEALKLNAEDLIKIGVIDEIIVEPLGGAHYDHPAVFASVRTFIQEQVNLCKRIALNLLLEQRYIKFRKIGVYSERETD